MRIKIRDAASRDLPQILEIERLSFDHPWSRDSFIRELALPFSRTIVAATHDAHKDALSGYLCRWLVADECHILNVAVHPEHRRSGLAAHLLTATIEEAREKSAEIVTL